MHAIDAFDWLLRQAIRTMVHLMLQMLRSIFWLVNL